MTATTNAATPENRCARAFRSRSSSMLGHRPHHPRPARGDGGVRAVGEHAVHPGGEERRTRPPRRGPTGRNRASSRNVQQCTARPAAWASATSEVGVARRPCGVAGDDQVLVRADGLRVRRRCRPRGTSAPGSTSWPIGTRRAPRSSRRLSNDSTITGASGVFSPAASSDASSGGPSGRPSRANRARVLELEVDADGAAQLGGQAGAQGEDLVEGRDGVAAVVRGVGGAQVGHALDGAQGAQLRERQVLDEPAVAPCAGGRGRGGRRCRSCRRARRRGGRRARRRPCRRGRAR